MAVNRRMNALKKQERESAQQAEMHTLLTGYEASIKSLQEKCAALERDSCDARDIAATLRHELQATHEAYSSAEKARLALSPADHTSNVRRMLGAVRDDLSGVRERMLTLQQEHQEKLKTAQVCVLQCGCAARPCGHVNVCGCGAATSVCLAGTGICGSNYVSSDEPSSRTAPHANCSSKRSTASP